MLAPPKMSRGVNRASLENESEDVIRMYAKVRCLIKLYAWNY